MTTAVFNVSMPNIEVECEYIEDSEDESSEYETYEEERYGQKPGAHGASGNSMDGIQDQLDDLTNMLSTLSVEKTKLKEVIELEKMHNSSLMQDNMILNGNLGATSLSQHSSEGENSDSTAGAGSIDNGMSRKRGRAPVLHRQALSCSDLSHVVDRAAMDRAPRQFTSRKDGIFNASFNTLPRMSGGGALKDSNEELHKTLPSRLPTALYQASHRGPTSVRTKSDGGSRGNSPDAAASSVAPTLRAQLAGFNLPPPQYGMAMPPPIPPVPAQYSALTIEVSVDNDDSTANDVVDMDDEPVYRCAPAVFGMAYGGLYESKSLPCSPAIYKGKDACPSPTGSVVYRDATETAAKPTRLFDVNDSETVDFLFRQLQDIQQKVHAEIAEKQRLEEELRRVKSERRSLEEMNENLRVVVAEMCQADTTTTTKKQKGAA